MAYLSRPHRYKKTTKTTKQKQAKQQQIHSKAKK